MNYVSYKIYNMFMCNVHKLWSGSNVTVSGDGALVMMRYNAGNVRQLWTIDKDDRIFSHSDHECTVGVDGSVTAGARCSASVEHTSSSNSRWLFYHL